MAPRTNYTGCADSSSADVYACVGKDIHQTCTVLHHTCIHAYKGPLLISNYITRHDHMQNKHEA